MAQPDASPARRRIRIRQVKSPIGFRYNQRQILAGMGLSRPYTSVVLEDSPSVRGMCKKIEHLVVIEELK